MNGAHRAHQELEPEPLAAREARQFVLSRCHEWGVQERLDTVTLLTSELVTNGVLHARTSLSVEVQVDEGTLTVEVHDHDRRRPAPRGPRLDLLSDIDQLLQREPNPPRTISDRHARLEVGPAGSIGAGRGLLLVDALADEWGVHEETDGKSVWFRLSV